MLRHASVLHDVGKLGIPDAILSKPGKLNADEWEIMKTHTTMGERILRGSQSPLVQMGQTIALTHHERWDGTGYPHGLAGTDIPLVGRIAAVCDVFDALLSTRPYKEPWPLERALAEVERSSGSHFDPDVVAAFLPIAVETHEDWVRMEMVIREAVHPVPA
jgi:putative two-component system response regulator